jgi:cytochrome c oxidase subunit 4
MTRDMGNPGLRKALRRVLLVWIALVLLVALTVGSAYIPLGTMNMAVNILIAGIKAGLIAAFFMHLASPHVVPRMVCTVALVMLSILFALSSVDYSTRDGRTDPPPSAAR